MLDFAGAGVVLAGAVGVVGVGVELSGVELDDVLSEVFVVAVDELGGVVGALSGLDGGACCCCCCITSLKLEESSLEGALFWDETGAGMELIAELADEIMLVRGCG